MVTVEMGNTVSVGTLDGKGGFTKTKSSYKHRYLSVISVIITIMCNAGCGSSPPECSNGDVKSKVIEIAKSHWIKNSRIVDLLETNEEPDIPREAEYITYLTMKEYCDAYNKHELNPTERDIKGCQDLDRVINIVENKSKEIKSDLTNIRTDKLDKDAKKCLCSASFNVKNYNYEIKYSAQLNDEGKINVEVMKFLGID